MTTYDPTTALLVVDVQNDFADPRGSLYVRGGDEIIPAINVEIEAARAAGATVVYTQDWHPPQTPHFRSSGGTWPDHCVEDTWGAGFHPDLVVLDGTVIRKGHGRGDGYSAFSVRDPHSGATWSTELEGVLHERGLQRLVVVGLATDYCVLQTVLDARRLGYEVEVLTYAVRAVDLAPGDGEAALERMREVGASLVGA